MAGVKIDNWLQSIRNLIKLSLRNKVKQRQLSQGWPDCSILWKKFFPVFQVNLAETLPSHVWLHSAEPKLFFNPKKISVLNQLTHSKRNPHLTSKQTMKSRKILLRIFSFPENKNLLVIFFRGVDVVKKGKATGKLSQKEIYCLVIASREKKACC